MAARASRVRNTPGQIQRQAPATSFMKPVYHSPGRTFPVAGQTDKDITSASELATPQDGRPQETKDLVEAMIELAEEEGVPTTPEVPEIERVQAEAVDCTGEVDQGLEVAREQGDA
ncbi:hypothetical protein LWI28_008973 [Acer negundo]|uniref:Uncharacterized protein n=1 Tax=Acer negundo TaxID=4023 RepID=A0AAD5JTZ8_ACENE|nr:hypothetical protein LWI28_008973 [Acer negundo]